MDGTLIILAIISFQLAIIGYNLNDLIKKLGNVIKDKEEKEK